MWSIKNKTLAFMNKDKFLYALILFCSLLIIPKDCIAQNKERKFRIDTNYVYPKPNYFFVGFHVGGYYTRYKLSTKDWLGANDNLHFSFFLKSNKIGLGFNFKPNTINPSGSLIFNDEVMTKFTSLNVINLEYYLSYSLDFQYGFSLEPYVGLNSVRFIVINEKELNQEFNLNRAKGFFAGGKIHRYWRFQTNSNTEFQEDLLFSIYADYYYSWTDFSPVHHRLTNNFYSWGFGVSFTYVIGYK